MSDVVVIGGGVVGAGAAYRLARDGVSVTLVDRADDGQATAAGAGIISPGTSYKPPAAFFPLAFKSVDYYETLLAELAEDGVPDTGYEVTGLLHVAVSDQEAARLPELFALFSDRLAAGVRNIGEVRLISGEEAQQLFPALGPVVRAIYTSGAARLDGRRLRDALVAGAASHGARVVRGSASLRMEHGRAEAVEVNGERIASGAVVLAGGAWSPELVTALPVRLSVYPQRGQIAHLELPQAHTSSWPVVVGFHSHYMLAFPENRVVAGATREDASGFDYRLTAGGVHETLSEALRIAPGLASATVREIRIGLRPASPDGLPILGKLPEIENVYAATGHGASGLQLGPYSGALVAALIQRRRVDLDVTPYLPDRFQN